MVVEHGEVLQDLVVEGYMVLEGEVGRSPGGAVGELVFLSTHNPDGDAAGAVDMHDHAAEAEGHHIIPIEGLRCVTEFYSSIDQWLVTFCMLLI